MKNQSNPDVGAHVAPVAHVLIRGRRGVFVAETCELGDGMVTATGRTRYRMGANHEDFAWGARARYSWPTREIREIRWLEQEDA